MADQIRQRTIDYITNLTKGAVSFLSASKYPMLYPQSAIANTFKYKTVAPMTSLQLMRGIKFYDFAAG
jgi:hypothetical protein